MLMKLQRNLYTLFVNRPILFAVLDVAIPLVIGAVAGYGIAKLF